MLCGNDFLSSCTTSDNEQNEDSDHEEKFVPPSPEILLKEESKTDQDEEDVAVNADENDQEDYDQPRHVKRSLNSELTLLPSPPPQIKSERESDPDENFSEQSEETPSRVADLALEAGAEDAPHPKRKRGRPPGRRDSAYQNCSTSEQTQRKMKLRTKSKSKKEKRVSEMTPEEHEETRIKWREKRRRSRQAIKAELDMHESTTDGDSNLEGLPTFRRSGSSTRKKKVSEMSPEERERMKAKWREEARRRRQHRKENMSEAEREKVLAKQREQKRAARAIQKQHMTPEQKANAEVSRLEKMTPEKKQAIREYQVRKRQEMTPAQRAEYNRKHLILTKARLSRMTPEQKKERAQRILMRRIEKKAEMTEEEKEAQKMRAYLKRMAKMSEMTEEEKDVIRQRERDRWLFRKSTMSTEEKARQAKRLREWREKKRIEAGIPIKRRRFPRKPRVPGQTSTKEIQRRAYLRRKVAMEKLLENGVTMDQLIPPEKREQNLLRQRVRGAKVRLKKKLEQSGVAPEMIEEELEKLEKSYQPSRPFKAYKPCMQRRTVAMDPEVVEQVWKELEAHPDPRSKYGVNFNPAAEVPPPCSNKPPRKRKILESTTEIEMKATTDLNTSVVNPPATLPPPQFLYHPPPHQQQAPYPWQPQAPAFPSHQHQFHPQPTNCEATAGYQESTVGYHFSPQQILLPYDNNSYAGSCDTATSCRSQDGYNFSSQPPQDSPGCVSSTSSGPTPPPVQVKVRKRRLQKSSDPSSVTCELCGQTFRQSYIREHQETAHNPHFQNGSCLLCGLSFRGARKFLMHYKSVHVTTPSNSWFKSKGVPRGQRSKKCTLTRDAVCELCGNAYFKDYLKKHKETMHNPHFKDGKCLLCAMTFPNSGEFWTHYRRVHRNCRRRGAAKEGDPQEVKKEEAAVMTVGNTSTTTSSGGRHICELCGQSYLRKWDLERHHQEKHTQDGQVPKKCPFCKEPRYFKGRSLYPHIIKHPEYHQQKNLLKCSLCSEEFFSEQDLQDHCKRDHAQAKFSCEGCHFLNFTKVGYLHHLTRCRKVGKERVQEIQRREEFRKVLVLDKVRLVCEFCKKKATIAKMSRHYKVIHELKEDPDFECDKCEEKLKSRETWVVHLMDNHEEMWSKEFQEKISRVWVKNREGMVVKSEKKRRWKVKGDVKRRQKKTTAKRRKGGTGRGRGRPRKVPLKEETEEEESSEDREECSSGGEDADGSDWEVGNKSRRVEDNDGNSRKRRSIRKVSSDAEGKEEEDHEREVPLQVKLEVEEDENFQQEGQPVEDIGLLEEGDVGWKLDDPHPVTSLNS